VINVVRSIVFAGMGLFVLAACSSGPVRSFNVGDELTQFDFSEGATFEEGVYADATLRITDGVYRITLNRGDNEIWWAQWGDSLDDVVVDVDVHQISEPTENAFGVACRLRGHVGQDLPVDPTLAAIASGEGASLDLTEEATAESTAEATEAATAEATETSSAAESTGTAAEVANGDGYLFLIQGSGSYAIMRARGRSITPLVNWTASDLVHPGPDRNQIRAVCIGDYLALYINGEFAADATDSTYRSGQVGLAASAASRLGVQVEFDNLIVHKAVSG
jgi:hypothetical protein